MAPKKKSFLESLLIEASNEAESQGASGTGTRHLFLALLDGSARLQTLIKQAGRDPTEIRAALSTKGAFRFTAQAPARPSTETTPNARRSLEDAKRRASQRNELAGEEDVLLSLIQREESSLGAVWKRFGLPTSEHLINLLETARTESSSPYRIEKEQENYQFLVRFHPICNHERTPARETELLGLLSSDDVSVLCDLTDTEVLGDAWAAWLYRMKLRAEITAARFHIRGAKDLFDAPTLEPLKRQLSSAFVTGPPT